MGLGERARATLVAGRIAIQLAQRELRSRGRFRNPKALALGFNSHRPRLYGFDRYPPALFISDWQAETRLSRLNSAEAKAILTNKLFFHYALDAAGLRDHAATLVGILADGIFHPHDGSPPLETRLASEALFVKPLSGHGGTSASLVTDPGQIPRHGMFVVETPIRQHPYADAIFPRSVNTMRIMTMRDDDGPFIAGAGHRFGTLRSAPVDNLGKGGILAGLSLETGRMRPAILDLTDIASRREPRHPDTGAAIDGVRVPRWEDVRRLVLRLAVSFPGIDFAGWDICMTPTGPLVVEGNASIPHPSMVQSHGPILTDRRVVDFLLHRGVIRGRHASRLHELVPKTDTT